jgi:hypothetical protein
MQAMLNLHPGEDADFQYQPAIYNFLGTVSLRTLEMRTLAFQASDDC